MDSYFTTDYEEVYDALEKIHPSGEEGVCKIYEEKIKELEALLPKLVQWESISRKGKPIYNQGEFNLYEFSLSPSFSLNLFNYPEHL